MGGKFGEKICEDLGIQYMSDLIRFSKEELQRRYDERNGQWLFNLARGIDLEAVTQRLVSKSFGCCKKFPGRNAITAMTTLDHWLHELAKEISERLEQDELENNRRPKQMVVSFVQNINNADVSSSRTVNLTTFDEEKIVSDAIDVLKRNTEKFFKSTDNNQILNNPIKFLGLNVGKFESTDVKKGNTIQNMFQRATIENKKNEAKEEETSAKGETKVNEIDNPATEINANDKVEVEENQDSNEDSKNDKNANEVEPKESFFAKYYRMKQQQRAEEEAKKAEEERQRDEEEKAASGEDSDEENKFNNDMLMEELEEHNHTSKQSESLQNPSTSTTSQYLQSYAEFYKPPELPKVECTQCGKKVNAHEIQIHTDEHFAFQLTQEQRAEFQGQLKRNITSTTPVAKKQKTLAISKTKTPIKSISIEKFLVKSVQDDAEAIPSTSTSTTTSTTTNVETEKCAECGKLIPIVDLFEHMDFHAAKKLQGELMRAEMNANQANNNTNQTSTGKSVNSTKAKKSKKKTTGNSTTNNTSKAMKNIASFFQN